MEKKSGYIEEQGKELPAVQEEKEGAGYEEEGFLIRLRKPYLFDRKEYTEIDLSGMEAMTGNDMIAINQLLGRSLSGSVTVPEVTMEYTCYFAGRAAKLPFEFFTGLPAREALRVKNCVVGFLFGQD